MAEPLRLTTIEGGRNWWKVINWAADAFRAAGFENAHAGRESHFDVPWESPT